jgi:hypothetical protein
MAHFVSDLAASLASLQQTGDQHEAKKLKLIIHVGTPKTGTTSLQTYLEKKQRKLRGKGILYPHNLEKLQNPTAPKHQWFEKNLVSANFDNFLENLKNIISQVKGDTHTIILSSEGIYNFWWDFPNDSKALLVELAKLFDVQIWVWFREHIAFIESYYKQCMRNPQIDNNPCYGKSLSFSEILNIPWFTQHLDYQGFIDDCRSMFGHQNVSVFEYKGDVVQELIQKLGLATPHDNPTPRQNKSLNAAAINILQTINRYKLTAKDKELLIPHLKEMNAVLETYAQNDLIDEDAKIRVLELSSPKDFNSLFS